MYRLALSHSDALPRPTLARRLRHYLARLDAAHDGQARLRQLDDAPCRDTSLSLQDLTGENQFDSDLPFYFRSGFGRR